MGLFFTTVFTSLFGWIAQYFTKKLAYGVAVAAVLFSVTTAFYVAMHALVGAIASTITDQWLLMGFYAVLPSNALTCLTACFTAELLAFLYRHQLITIKAVSSAS